MRRAADEPVSGPPPPRGGSATLLALGNPLLGDDGLGERLLELLEERWTIPARLETRAGGNSGLDLLPVVEDSERLLVVDAIDAGLTPGRLVVLEGDEIPLALGRAVSPHHVGIAQVFALAAARGRLPERRVAMGLQPGPPREGLGLSPPLEAGLPRLLRCVAERLAAWGIPLSG